MTSLERDWIENAAQANGFSDFGIAAPDHDFSTDLSNYLAKGYHGEMEWMERRENWRANPKTLWPECQSIIMLASKYPKPSSKANPHQGEISTYAQGRDYHDLVKKRLKAMGRQLIQEFGGEIKVFVDTAPVMEKPLAAQSGLGWVGKHGNLLSRTLGNWFFLGSIFTSLPIAPDPPAKENCGTCRSCLDACPTNAFDAEGHLDARRCISYLTIESSQGIPIEFRKAMGNLIYGCDICLNACPWNKFDAGEIAPQLLPRIENQAPDLVELLGLDDAAFRARFSGSPIKRVGWLRFMRNCLIAAGNSGQIGLREAVAPFLDHPDDILREHANWAMEELCKYS